NTAKPALSGTAIVGQSLSTTSGTWTPTPTSYSFAWHRCDATGNGCSKSPTSTNAPSYALTTGDAGHTVVAQVAPDGDWSSAVDTTPSGVVQSPSSGPPTTGLIPGIGTLLWGSTFPSATHLDRYSFVGESGGYEDAAAQLPGTVVTYVIGSSLSASWWSGV